MNSNFKLIRKWIEDNVDKNVADKIRIIYGGPGINEGNAASYVN